MNFLFVFQLVEAYFSKIEVCAVRFLLYQNCISIPKILYCTIVLRKVRKHVFSLSYDKHFNT